jgi:hypothetical protein
MGPTEKMKQMFGNLAIDDRRIFFFPPEMAIMDRRIERFENI